MTEHRLAKVKDLGLQREVMDALPYAVVRDAYKASFEEAVSKDDEAVLMNHIVAAGHQLKILFLRVWTQRTDGAKFVIEQHTPGTGEAGYPAVGSAPEGVVDYPMLEAAGAEVLRGSLKDPVHVTEGSIEFKLQGPVDPADDAGAKYSVTWWGVEKIPVPP